jgi:hypothetical protein
MSFACEFNQADIKASIHKVGNFFKKNKIKSSDRLGHNEIIITAKDDNYLWQSIVNNVSLYWQCQSKFIVCVNQ